MNLIEPILYSITPIPLCFNQLQILPQEDSTPAPAPAQQPQSNPKPINSPVSSKPVEDCDEAIENSPASGPVKNMGGGEAKDALVDGVGEITVSLTTVYTVFLFM